MRSHRAVVVASGAAMLVATATGCGDSAKTQSTTASASARSPVTSASATSSAKEARPGASAAPAPSDPPKTDGMTATTLFDGLSRLLDVLDHGDDCVKMKAALDDYRKHVPEGQLEKIAKALDVFEPYEVGYKRPGDGLRLGAFQKAHATEVDALRTRLAAIKKRLASSKECKEVELLLEDFNVLLMMTSGGGAGSPSPGTR